MALYIAGSLKSELPSDSSEQGVEQITAKLLKSCTRYLPLEPDEELVLFFDETLLGSGKEGIAITSQRLLSFDKEKLKLNLPLAEMERVKYGKLDYDTHGLVITRSGGRRLRLRLGHANATQAQVAADEILMRLRKGAEVASEWQCPSCGPGVVVYLPLARVIGPTKQVLVALVARDLHICRSCGASTMEIKDPGQAVDMPGAELCHSVASAPDTATRTEADEPS